MSGLFYERAFDPKDFYRYTFKPAVQRAGLGDLMFHDLRRTGVRNELVTGSV